MKNSLFFILVFITYVAVAQERQETITREIALTGTMPVTLWVDNVNGFIHVQGYDGTKVLFTVNKWVKASDKTELDKLWDRLKLVTQLKDDTIETYIDGICKCNCGYHNRHYGNDCDFDGDYTFDITIKVPENINLLLSTVNKGDVDINNINGSMHIGNVNGGITMTSVKGPANVNTINGDVLIRYAGNPTEYSKFYTLNGKLTVYFPPDLSADLSFKTFNGNYYTDFDYTMLPLSTLVSANSGGHGTAFKIDKKTGVRVGNGGVNLDFETFNGNIYIRKLKNEN